MIFERHEQWVGRSAIGLREREAETFAVVSDQRRQTGGEALVSVAAGAVVVAQRELVGTVQTAIGRIRSTDDLAVQGLRQEVIPAEVECVGLAREIHLQVGATDDGGRGQQHRARGPTREVVHEQEVSLEHVSAKRLRSLQPAELRVHGGACPQAWCQLADLHATHKALDHDDLDHAILDVLFGDDTEAKRITGIGISLGDRIRQSEDRLDRDRIAGLMWPERAELLGGERFIPGKLELLEFKRERRSLLRS